MTRRPGQTLRSCLESPPALAGKHAAALAAESVLVAASWTRMQRGVVPSVTRLSRGVCENQGPLRCELACVCSDRSSENPRL